MRPAALAFVCAQGQLVPNFPMLPTPLMVAVGFRPKRPVVLASQSASINTAYVELIIATWADGDWVNLDVRDNGRGIPPEKLKKLFDPIFTEHEDR
jgi:hypothetical protein